ncbi:MAG: MBL fold metallo-hydrolase, partial [Rhodospirillaceae bacterium]|nr:MBL fold metallo-hydrolase [Rhodospirillaceae bacterium]
MSHTILGLRRRTLLGAAGTVALGGLAPVLGGGRPAHALVDFSGPQAPGFFRFRVGNFEVLSVSDGSLTLAPATDMVPNAQPRRLEDLLAANGRPTDRLYAQTNVLLVNTGDHLVLVDVGSGANFQATAGRLVENLAAAGIDAAAIDTVVLTHAHPDHCWGIIDDATGEPRFPNANYFVRESEWAFWTADETLGSAPEGMRGMIQMTKANLLPVTDRTELLGADAEVVPGIRMVETPGHTPGHVSLLISSGDAQLFCTGDCMTSDIISFAHPEWYFAYDLDPELAVTTRRVVFDRVETDGIPIIGYH